MSKKPFLFLLALAFLWLPALAQDEPGQTEGPAKIELGTDLATLDLPKGFGMIDKAHTTEILKSGGNTPDGKELGAIYLVDDPGAFLVLLSYDPQGYVKDDEANDINAAEMLQSYKDGTESSNEGRKAAGVAELHVTGWGEEPRYDKATHHLIWALTAVSGKDDPVVNFETRVLGREGVMSMTLICSPQDLDRFKPKMDTLLKNTTYVDGKRYADFKEGDKVSEVGLLALLAGGAAAAKLGLFAKLGKLLLWALIAGKKLIVIGIAVAVGLYKKVTGRGGSGSLPVAGSASPPDVDDHET